MKFASPDIEFELEGYAKPFKIRFSTEALAVLQDHWGLANLNETWKQVATMDGDGLTKDDYDAIMWAALRCHHPDIGRDEAAQILSFIGLPRFTMLVGQSAGSAFAQGGGGTAPENPPKKRPGR